MAQRNPYISKAITNVNPVLSCLQATRGLGHRPRVLTAQAETIHMEGKPGTKVQPGEEGVGEKAGSRGLRNTQ